MRIFLASDLHAEFDQGYGLPEESIDFIVLAGDIDRSTGAVRVADWYQKQAQVHVILIAGNHEYYRGDFTSVLANLKADASELEHVHFLENDSVVINGIRFLGCTLWTNFMLYGKSRVETAQRDAAQYITDFRVIRNGNRSLRTADVIAKFEESYAWLEAELAKPFSGKTVVVTHFVPHPDAIHPRYKVDGGDLLTAYFVPDCSELIKKFDIDVWMCGHTHNSVDVIVEGKTRLVSNQGGYPREDPSYVQFDQNKIIVL